MNLPSFSVTVDLIVVSEHTFFTSLSAFSIELVTVTSMDLIGSVGRWETLF